VDIAAKAKPVWAFKASDGKIYTLLKTRRLLALFVDKRLRARGEVKDVPVDPVGGTLGRSRRTRKIRATKGAAAQNSPSPS